MMDLQFEKQRLIERLEAVEDVGLILALKGVLDYGLGKKTGYQSLETYNSELQQAEEEIAAGYGIDHQSVVDEAKSW